MYLKFGSFVSKINQLLIDSDLDNNGILNGADEYNSAYEKLVSNTSSSYVNSYTPEHYSDSAKELGLHHHPHVFLLRMLATYDNDSSTNSDDENPQIDIEGFSKVVSQIETDPRKYESLRFQFVREFDTEIERLERVVDSFPEGARVMTVENEEYLEQKGKQFYTGKLTTQAWGSHNLTIDVNQETEAYIDRERRRMLTARLTATRSFRNTLFSYMPGLIDVAIMNIKEMLR